MVWHDFFCAAKLLPSISTDYRQASEKHYFQFEIMPGVQQDYVASMLPSATIEYR